MPPVVWLQFPSFLSGRLINFVFSLQAESEMDKSSTQTAWELSFQFLLTGKKYPSFLVKLKFSWRKFWFLQKGPFVPEDYSNTKSPTNATVDLQARSTQRLKNSVWPGSADLESRVEKSLYRRSAWGWSLRFGTRKGWRIPELGLEPKPKWLHSNF